MNTDTESAVATHPLGDGERCPRCRKTVRRPEDHNPVISHLGHEPFWMAPVGPVEPPASEVAELWTRLLGSTEPRPDSAAMRGLRALVASTDGRWWLQPAASADLGWLIKGWAAPDGQSTRAVYVRLGSGGEIIGWSLSRSGGWGTDHVGVHGLAEALLSEVAP